MTENGSPIVTIAKLALEHWTQGTLYESRDTSFGALLGLKALGIGYGEVPPGKSGCPFHSHHVEDELFVILDGHGTYRYGEARHLVGPGDVLGAPAGGPETAHQIINTGTVPLKYLSISSMAATEICEYPVPANSWRRHAFPPAGRPSSAPSAAPAKASTTGRANPVPDGIRRPARRGCGRCAWRRRAPCRPG